MALITTRTLLLVPGKQTLVVFTPVSGNYLRVWVTDAPKGSSYANQLNDSSDGRIRITELKEVVDGTNKTFQWRFTPDKGGKFLLTIQEYNRGSAYGGSYGDDANAQLTETVVGSEDTSQAITVCQRLTQDIGAGADRATLVLYVSDSLIKTTTVETHGEKTPALIDPTSSRAETAIVDEDVVTALEALEDSNASTALGSLSTMVTTLITAFNGHLDETGIHYTDDAASVVDNSFKDPDSPKALEDAVAELFARVKRHFENQDINQSGVGSNDYHQSGGETRADWTNRLVTSPGGETATVIAGIADIHRAYEAHRVDTDYHQAQDTTNTGGALSPLLELHSAFIAAVQKFTPSTPSTANSAATTLIHGAGFEEKDL